MDDIFPDTSFYYFYSTVPQVLAGGIALIGAFLIFFITESNKNLYRILKESWHYIEDWPDHVYGQIIKHFRSKFSFKMDNIDYIEKQYYNEIFERIKKRSIELDDEGFMRFYNVFKFEFDLKSKVIKKGTWAIVLSGILMAISILILPFVQGLIKFLPLGIFITVLIIGFSCYAIYLIANVVVSAIRKL